jgi:hypothetical protein
VRRILGVPLPGRLLCEKEIRYQSSLTPLLGMIFPVTVLDPPAESEPRFSAALHEWFGALESSWHSQPSEKLEFTSYQLVEQLAARQDEPLQP